ncbi:methyltransferase domain-containing protein [Marivirga harenae]|uniref:class I SAM-dependent methyltransferase n=1 Tax=Marivirga harenae TaxID=2010992 RepID=UPI0026DFFFD0|nr:methyltransferase domain-containing protein [Marivirga harenae]WKV12907.1 methyltransferase domain-containing protein [Marivirga harenae]|tara:strand:- start:54389 stop:55165 length:777 start_codon:yes stop_codon:yes gene_type:complete
MNSKLTPKYTRYADIKRLAFIVSNLREWHENPEDVHILDVGCGNGIISLNLGELGYNVHGIELSEDAIKIAKDQNKFSNVIFEKANAETLKLEGKKYDVVICSEVLEHLNQPENLLEELRYLIKNNGALIVTVPNGVGPRELFVTRPFIKIRNNNGISWKLLSSIKSKLGYSGTTIQSAASDLDHIQFFTKKQLRKLAENSGFEIVMLKSANFIDDVFPFSIVARNSISIQKFDSKVADLLPTSFSGGYHMVWRRKED